MLILGIETSCDECSLALVEDGLYIKEMVVYSQLKEHLKYGGVVPELASRLHVEYISILYQQLLEKYSLKYASKENLDATAHPVPYEGIAVTVGPGLSGSLMAGLNFAKGLSLALDIPLIGIDHIQAHFYSAQLQQPVEYPHIGVVVSGGHTLIGIVHSYDTIEIKGTSIDDACGEAFEKIARALDMGYPGGPAIDALAQQGNADAANFPVFSFKKHGYNFSYSGLKTAVLHHRDNYWNHAYPQTNAHIAAAFQRAAIDMIVERVTALVSETGISRVVFGGGVAANTYLKARMGELEQARVQSIKLSITRNKHNNSTSQVVFPAQKLCTDNAAMIAGLGYQYLIRHITSPLELEVNARLMEYRTTEQSNNKSY